MDCADSLSVLHQPTICKALLATAKQDCTLFLPSRRARARHENREATVELIPRSAGVPGARASHPHPGLPQEGKYEI